MFQLVEVWKSKPALNDARQIGLFSGMLATLDACQGIPTVSVGVTARFQRCA
jgi:hypothetical protein